MAWLLDKKFLYEGEIRPLILYEPIVMAKIRLMMDEYPSREWFAWLHGTQEGNDFYITDLTIPEQYASSGECEPIDNSIPEGVVGALHSHHSMGVFWSSTDRTGVNRNNKLSIVVSKRAGELEFLTNVQVPLANGDVLMVEGQLLPVEVQVPEDFLAEAKANIKSYPVKKYTEPATTSTKQGNVTYFDKWQEYGNSVGKYKDEEEEVIWERENDLLKDLEERICYDCNGSGREAYNQYCMSCQGEGIVIVCPDCDGTFTALKDGIPCISCDGFGYLSVWDAEALLGLNLRSFSSSER